MNDKEAAELADKVVKWCSKNPYVLYGDYRDQLSDEQIKFILKGEFDAFFDNWSECRMHDDIYWDWDGHFSELLEELTLDEGEADDSELIEFVRETFDENTWVDDSDLLKTCCDNSKPHIVAIPYIGKNITNGELDVFEFPCAECDDEENERRNAILKEYLGIDDGFKAECMYPYDILKICGTVDLWEIVGKRIDLSKNLKIKISPQMYARPVAHNSFNGAGGCGDIKITKTGVFPCTLYNDYNNRYGIQAVFGFTEAFWSENLDLVYSEQETKD